LIDVSLLLGIVLIDRSGDYSNRRVPYLIYRDYQEQNRVFSELLGYATASLRLCASASLR